MAIETPRRPEEELHGERTPKPRFGPGSDDPLEKIPVASQEGIDHHKSKHNLGDSTPDEKKISPESLKSAEQTADKGPGAKDQLGAGYNPSDSGTVGQRLGGKLRAINLKSRRSIVTIGIVGLLGGGGLFGVSILQGPLQFIHFAQLLQQFHLRSNEDFGDSRTAKVLLYGMLGKGTERGQLGTVGNVLADRYEKKMVRDTGMRPVFDNDPSRFAGWEVVDEEKAKKFVDDYERNGGKIKSINEAGGRGVRGTGKSASKVNPQNKFIDLRGNGFKQELTRRSSLKEVSRATGIFRIASPVGFRLTAQRGNINLHPIKRILSDKASNRADAKALKEEQEKLRQETAEQQKGDTTTGVGSTPESEKAAEDAKNVPEGTSEEAHRLSVAKAAGPVAVFGLICGVSELGKSAEEIKYTNNIMPMIRMGGSVIAMGNQAMSGDDIGLKELGAFQESLYDEESGTSWAQAASIQAEQGKKPTGPDIPKEGNLRKTADRPDFFVVVDDILNTGVGPIKLQTGCDAFNLVASFVPGFINDLSSWVVNRPLALAGTSTEELTAGLISIINGEAVDTLAQGADFGNYANTGAFLAANDQAVTMGGVGLTDQEVAQLDQREAADDRIENSQKSFYAKYINPYNVNSLVSSLSYNSTFSLSDPISSMANIFSPKMTRLFPGAKAATKYDYGVAKYGYSVDEQEDDNFEDPYINAARVEPKLEGLNDKYGKCFGMKVYAENGTVRLESDEQTLNLLKLEKDDEYKDCREDRNNEDFKQYRFYLADVQTTLSLACFEGDAEACSQLGMSSGTEGTDSGGSEEPGLEINLDDLAKDSSNISCAEGTKDLGVQDGYTEGKKVPIRACAVLSVPETGGLSPISGADGKLVVNSRLSAFYVNLAEKAKSDGVGGITANEGFRTMEQQECFYAGGCGATGPGAKPGYSNHQLGVAVDWGGSMVSWLNQNGNKYGLKALVPGEPWHWSPTGN